MLRPLIGLTLPATFLCAGRAFARLPEAERLRHLAPACRVARRHHGKSGGRPTSRDIAPGHAAPREAALHALVILADLEADDVSAATGALPAPPTSTGGGYSQRLITLPSSGWLMTFGRSLTRA